MLNYRTGLSDLKYATEKLSVHCEFIKPTYTSRYEMFARIHAHR
jgi:hypothetical protein